MRLCLLSTLLAVPAFAQTLVPAGSAQTPVSYSDRGPCPCWTRGVLLDLSSNDSAAPVIHVFEEAGRESTPIAVTIPGDNRIRIDHIARGPDGAYAFVSYTFSTPLGVNGGFVARISPDHQIRRFDTGSYVPFQVTIAPDGTIWTVGAEMVDGAATKDPHQRLIRHFDQNGEQLGSYFERSSFAAGKWMGLPQGLLVSNRDRIGWYARIAQQYTEVTFNGKVCSYPGFAPPMSRLHITGLALTDRGDAIASVAGAGKDHATVAIYRLDRSAKAWLPLPLPAGVAKLPSWPVIYGGDGNRIVIAGDRISNAGYDLKFFELR